MKRERRSGAYRCWSEVEASVPLATSLNLVEEPRVRVDQEQTHFTEGPGSGKMLRRKSQEDSRRQY